MVSSVELSLVIALYSLSFKQIDCPWYNAVPKYR